MKPEVKKALGIMEVGAGAFEFFTPPIAGAATTMEDRCECRWQFGEDSPNLRCVLVRHHLGRHILGNTKYETKFFPGSPKVVLTVDQARALLDACAACLDDTGHPSKQWFPKQAQRIAVESAINVLRISWETYEKNPTADL